MEHLVARGIAFDFDPDCGMIRNFTVEDAGRTIRPLHRAPWEAGDVPEGAEPHLARLEGDFFCAPFSDGGGMAPILHGWTANAHWRVSGREPGAALEATLERSVAGTEAVKRLHLIGGHPFLYQSHRFSGGSGVISAANHAMVALPGGGRLSFSPKRLFRTPATALETDPKRGRSRLAYPADATDPRAFPGADGGTVDLTEYPFGPAHEDFVVAIEANGRAFGWTAVVRTGQGDAVLSLRNAAQLPMTMLWHSNGGRDYPPWSGRHLGCLGVEEGRAPHILGEEGGFELGHGPLDIRHAIGAIAWPSGERIADVRLEGGSLTVKGEAGADRQVPFDSGHLLL